MEAAQRILDAAWRFGIRQDGSAELTSAALIDALQRNKVPLLSLQWLSTATDDISPLMIFNEMIGDGRSCDPSLKDLPRGGETPLLRRTVPASIIEHHRLPLLEPASGAGASAGSPFSLLALVEDAGFRAALAAEQQVYTVQRKEYEQVHYRLRADGVETLFVKPAGIAPSFPHTSDNLDVLIRPHLTGVARDVLMRSGYVELRNVEEPHKFLFRKFRDGESVSAIHLHEQVGWCVPFFEEDALWERSRLADDELIRIPSPEDALLINLAHTVYENKAIKQYDLLKICHCLGHPSFDWDYAERTPKRRGWLHGLYTGLLIYDHLIKETMGQPAVPEAILARARERVPGWIRRHVEQWLAVQPVRLPYRLSFLFSKRLIYTKILNDELRSPRQKARDVIQHTANGAKLKLGVSSQPSMLISLSGADGSGKTVHAATLRKALGVCRIRTRYVWARANSSGPAAWLSGLGRTLYGRRSPNGLPPEAKLENRETLLRRPVIGAAWSLLAAIDLGVRYAIQVRIPLSLGYVVICDRYIYDAMVDRAAFSGKDKVGGPGSRLLKLLCPPPRVRLLFEAPVKTLAARRLGAEPEWMLTRQIKLYRQLADDHGLRVIDTERDPVATSDAIVVEILSQYFQDFRTAINGFFLANPKRGQS